MHGQQLSGRFSLGSEAAKEGVIDCIIYGDGLVALTGQHILHFATSLLNDGSSIHQIGSYFQVIAIGAHQCLLSSTVRNAAYLGRPCMYGRCRAYALPAATGAYRLWVVSNLEEPRPQKLALDGLSERPHCMAVIEPRHTLSGCVEVGALPGLAPCARRRYTLHMRPNGHSCELKCAKSSGLHSRHQPYEP